MYEGASIEPQELQELRTLGSRQHSPHEVDETRTTENEVLKTRLVCAYALAMGVCGIILVAIGQTLSELAGSIGLTAEDIGSVFILRGVGAVAGSLVSAHLYHDYPGNLVIAASLLSLAVSIFLLPFSRSIIGLHVLFLLLGLGTAITDTGCQILSRKLHGVKAGPFLGLNTVAFGISGALVPVVNLFFAEIYARFAALTLIILGVFFLVLLSPDPTPPPSPFSSSSSSSSPSSSSLPALANYSPGRRSHNSEGTMITVQSPCGTWHTTSDGEDSIKQSTTTVVPEPPHFRVEAFISCITFSLIGGKVTLTAYLEAYVQQTGIISVGQEHRLMLLFWICVTLGRVVGIQNQRFFTDTTLPLHLCAAAACGSLAGLLLFLCPKSPTIFWLCIPAYGFANGPCLGYAYDLNNRLTYPTEASMSIVMMGLNAGASLVPFLTSVVWREFVGPQALLTAILLSCFLPLPLLFCALQCSYTNKSPLGLGLWSPPRSYQSISEELPPPT